MRLDEFVRADTDEEVDVGEGEFGLSESQGVAVVELSEEQKRWKAASYDGVGKKEMQLLVITQSDHPSSPLAPERCMAPKTNEIIHSIGVDSDGSVGRRAVDLVVTLDTIRARSGDGLLDALLEVEGAHLCEESVRGGVVDCAVVSAVSILVRVVRARRDVSGLPCRDTAARGSPSPGVR